MNFSPSNFITYETVLLDILVRLDDEEFRKFSKGYYKAQIQSCLEQLSYETKMFVVEKDYDMPTNLILEIPENCFDLREIYAYDGSCCNKGTAKQLWWKRDYRTKGLTEGYTTKVMKDTYDPFIKNYPSADNTYFYGIENGIIYLSPSCSGYSKINVVFNGSFVGLGQDIKFPIQLRKVIVDYVVMECLSALSARDPRTYSTLYDRAYAKLYDLQAGSWHKARRWGKELDTASRESLLEYLSRPNE